MQSKGIYRAFGVGVVVLIAVVLWWVAQSHTASETETQKDASVSQPDSRANELSGNQKQPQRTSQVTGIPGGMQLTHDANLELSELTATDTKDGIMLRLQRQAPATLVTVKLEKGLGTVVSLAKKSPVEVLLENAKRAYPGRYQDFQLHSESRLQVDGRQAADMVFRYKGPSGDIVRQALRIVEVSSDTAVLVAIQVRDSEFEALYESSIKPTLDSIQL